jgi:hypothetical protein
MNDYGEMNGVVDNRALWRDFYVALADRLQPWIFRLRNSGVCVWSCGKQGYVEKPSSTPRQAPPSNIPLVEF